MAKKAAKAKKVADNMLPLDRKCAIKAGREGCRPHVPKHEQPVKEVAMSERILREHRLVRNFKTPSINKAFASLRIVADDSLVGQKFGRRVVVGPRFLLPQPHGDHQSHAVVECECGIVRCVRTATLPSKQSCGCNGGHGWLPERLYGIWRGMIRRCYDERSTSYHNYGARGVSVCPAWRASWSAFREWSLSNGYEESLSLDRIDNSGNYEPTNCRWVDRVCQARNKRGIRVLFAFGESKCIAEWSRDERCAVGEAAIRRRLRTGMSPEDAISRPSRYQ